MISTRALVHKRRILVVGSGGAGKSMLAIQLGRRLALPIVHLDALYWRPGWQPNPAAEWRDTGQRIVARDAWIIDGNYSGSLDLRLPVCDAVVFLDIPRSICLCRVVKRRLKAYFRSGSEVAPGCPTRLTWEFLRWVWQYPTVARARVQKPLESLPTGVELIVVSSTAQVVQLCGDLRETA